MVLPDGLAVPSEDQFFVCWIHQNYLVALMRDSDWLKLRLIFLICVQMQILCNGATHCSNSLVWGRDIDWDSWCIIILI